MGRKSKRDAPSWAYYDNPKSKFVMVYADMLKSEPFMELSGAAQLFYLKCLAHSNEEKAKECLYQALKEHNSMLGLEVDESVIKRAVYDDRKKLFVFPKKQYEQYGYSKSHASKLFKELTEKGFIKIYQQGKIARKVNIYEFSSKWKNASTNG